MRATEGNEREREPARANERDTMLTFRLGARHELAPRLT